VVDAGDAVDRAHVGTGAAGNHRRPYRLDLAAGAGGVTDEAAASIRRLVDAAVAELETHQRLRRAHRSVYFAESGSFVQINVRESRTGSVTVSFGHGGGAERVGYVDLVRMAPVDLLTRVLDAHSAQVGPPSSWAGYVHGGRVVRPPNR
jgi:hypothetical protein